MLLGIIAIAAALKNAIGHPATPSSLAQALFLSPAALALFLAGDVVFRASLRIGPRALARGGGACSRSPRSRSAPRWRGVAQLAALVVVLAGAFALERAQNTQRVAVLG